MSTIEAGIVSRLRNKIGDNPTTIVVNGITGATHSAGVVSVTTLNNHELMDGMRLTISDVLGMTDLNSNFTIFNAANKGFDVPLTTIQSYISAGTYIIQLIETQIWSDAELLEALSSANTQVFKGNRGFDELDEYDIEIVLLRCDIDLTYQLAKDSARYSRYILRDVNAKKVDPNEFLKMAEALEARLGKMLEELDDDDSGNIVHQSVFRVEDRDEDILIPTQYEADQPIPKFTLSSVATGVQIAIAYKFVPAYKLHFIKQIDSGGTENIIEELYRLKSENIIDTTVVDGSAYSYKLYIKTLNNELFESDAQSITYAAP